ncbi:MAG: PD40 domain-containing protein [Bacteroidia bacterium]|nr:PD40 domain-containing protein [Bacteroidia bacterium]
MKIKNILFLLLFVVAVQACKAQVNSTDKYTCTDKKSVKAFEEAKTLYGSHKDVEAVKMLNKAIKECPNFAEAYTMLAYIAMDKNDNDKAIEYFEKSLSLSSYFPQNYFQLGGIYYYTAKYEQASKAFAKLLSFPRLEPQMRTAAEYFKECADFSVDAVKNPKPFKPVNAGPSINSQYQEYFPTVTADNSVFYYTRNYTDQTNCSGSPGQEDFLFTTHDEKGQWKPSIPLREINSGCNEGAPTISANGQFMFFTACGDIDNKYGPNKEDGYGSCDIFYSDKIGGKWSKPINVGLPINTKNWETQPSFSSDGKTLYFVRGLIERGGKHKGDIYCATIGANGKFGDPVKLGPNINTEGSEESVFIHPDNMTLYFSSNGRVGLGELDIFMSKRQADGEWGPAVNLGYPINTNKSENSLLVDPSGNLAYFASNREGGFGGLDLYSFAVPEEFLPEKITYAKGLVYDSLTREPMKADFELVDLATGKTTLNSFSNNAGNFLLTIGANKNYMVNVSKPGYLFYSNKFRMKEEKTDFEHPFILNIPMLKLDTGKSIVLENVYFDTDSAVLRPESHPELDKLIQFLNTNPKVSIEISGHTDNTGDKKKNQILSEKRAKAVYQYILSKSDVEPTRMKYKGYGDKFPRRKNDTAQNKQLNRRTEYKVIGIAK